MAKALTFNDSMKAAILCGCKTVTRRPIKFPCQRSGVDSNMWYWESVTSELTTAALNSDVDILIPAHTRLFIKSAQESLIAHCPYGSVGDLVELATRRAKRDLAIFARATLTAISVEHLHDISEQEAIAEGMPKDDPRTRFLCTWDGIYESSPYGWFKDPAVWVLTFEVTEILPGVPE